MADAGWQALGGRRWVAGAGWQALGGRCRVAGAGWQVLGGRRWDRFGCELNFHVHLLLKGDR